MFPELSFVNLTPISVGIANVAVETGSLPSRQPPNVEHLSPVSFGEAVRAWSKARFVSNGVGSVRLLIELETGAIREQRLNVDRGLGGLLKNEQAIEYEARVQVVIKAIGLDGVVYAEVKAETWQTKTLPESASSLDRRTLLFEMVEATMQAMDQKIIPEFRKYFSTYIL